MKIRLPDAVVNLIAVFAVFTGILSINMAAQSQEQIRIPENLPEPMDEEMRVQGPDLDSVLADQNVVLLDVREPWELEKFGTRKGYINIPLGELEDRLGELPADKTILTA